MTQAIKNCSTCNKDLPITDFNINKKAVDGLQSICRACHIEYKASYEQTSVSIATQRFSSLKWNNGNKTKTEAHKQVKAAIRNGNLHRQPCEQCESLKTEAHHEDYSKPLDVNWLCRKHHRERHQDINEYFRNNPQLVLI